MAAKPDALELLRQSPSVIAASSKAAGSGGVAVSALEMAQNSVRYNWTHEEVDAHLQRVIDEIYDSSVAAAETYGYGYDLIAGANIAAFEKIASSMLSEGLF